MGERIYRQCMGVRTCMYRQCVGVQYKVGVRTGSTGGVWEYVDIMRIYHICLVPPVAQWFEEVQ